MKNGIGLASAVWTLTRFPFPGKPSRNIATPLFWYGFTGLLLGAVASVISSIISLASYLPFLESAVFTMTMAYLSRGFHLDGLGDMADGLAGGFTPERRLEIMSDTHSGSFSVIAICVCLICKTVAGGELLNKGTTPLILMLSATWARSSIVFLCLISSYAKPDGKARGITDGCHFGHLVVSVLTSVVATALFWNHCSLTVLLAPTIAFLVTTVVIHFISKSKIGGITGDVCGACCEITETAALMLMAILC